MRDRLIEIFKKTKYNPVRGGLEATLAVQFSEYALNQIVDKLLAEGIIAPPCKVGEIVYVIEPLWYGIWVDDEHKCRRCKHFYEGGMGDNADCSLGKNCCYHIVEEETDLRKIADWIIPSTFTEEIAWGKTVFLDRAAAEAKLREMGGNNNEYR